MGFQIPRTFSLSSSKTVILNATTKPILSKSKLLSLPNAAGPASVFKTNFRIFARKPITGVPISATGFRRSLNGSKRSFRGDVVAMAAPGSIQKSEEDWRAILSPEQFRILRQKGTEYPGTGEYDKFFSEGVYGCAGCRTPLYRSTTKFNSGCGWPAFYEGLPGAINRNGYDLIKQNSPLGAYAHTILRVGGQFTHMSYSHNQQLCLPSSARNYRTRRGSFVSGYFSEGTHLLFPSVSNWGGFCFSKHSLASWERSRVFAALDVANAVEVINDLGLDTLTFLAVTVLVVPAFKIIRASPILGFFFGGIVLNQFGLFRNLTDVKVLSEWGILFLLFEMGLELSFARLKALAKFAFGMGLTQVLLSTLAFTAFELPPNGAIGTRILEFLFHSRPDLVKHAAFRCDTAAMQPSVKIVGNFYNFKDSRSSCSPIYAATPELEDLEPEAEYPPFSSELEPREESLTESRMERLVNIRSIDEAVVIGAALSLSSSAFVLQLLAEKGELPTRFGSATLGILLLQDIAVVPLLVILPVLESQNMVGESIWPMLAQESLKALGGLGLLSLAGKYILRRVFEVVAEARSSEAFVALCLLTVAGTSLLTQKLGFSDTLGAFLGGALLAETNFRTQIEADIRPFRGLLLGLFFVTTGTSVDLQLLFREWPNVLSLLAGLIAIKTLIITAIGPRVGLTLQESVRIGLLLSQGGEFGFVVFSLANRLGVLPLELNKLLIIVVVLSMALTPFLNEAGRRAAKFIENNFDADDKDAEMGSFEASEPVVILGFGQMGQVLANFLSAPLASGLDGDSVGLRYVAFDLDPSIVKASRKLGFPVLYGDGSRPAVLQSAGITSPKAVMVMYTGRERTMEAVQRLRLAFPAVPIYARAQDLMHLLDLKKAGAADAVLENAETSLQLGSKLLQGLGVMSDDVSFLSQLVRDSMELQAQEALSKTDGREFNIMKPLQVRVADLIGDQVPISSTTPGDQISGVLMRDATHSLRIQQEVDEARRNTELQHSEDSGKGVFYCELETKNSFPVKTEDAEGEKNTVDPSIPCVTTKDEP
ncbi:K(+) efflux antiporter 3, chloroplastic [Morella rubra]|uniref:K(+) efflux antiporter 3, chloroplastic n=1 Tax=Morella rubra TaxID=262757 RepID=A0A6A1V202_9ROSI|nr:K(+) efflux antiporter 3, chloroplastic [Morella rubra]